MHFCCSGFSAVEVYQSVKCMNSMRAFVQTLAMSSSRLEQFSVHKRIIIGGEALVLAVKNLLSTQICIQQREALFAGDYGELSSTGDTNRAFLSVRSTWTLISIKFFFTCWSFLLFLCLPPLEIWTYSCETDKRSWQSSFMSCICKINFLAIMWRCAFDMIPFLRKPEHSICYNFHHIHTELHNQRSSINERNEFSQAQQHTVQKAMQRGCDKSSV